MTLPDCPACQMSPRLQVGDFRPTMAAEPLYLRYCSYCGFNEPAQKGDVE
jgi:hypothetical protein